jgi:hypothetical protein
LGSPARGWGDAPIVASRPFSLVLAFTVLVWLPVVGYFVAFHGDWAYLYVVPWRRVPSAVDLGLVLASGAALLGAFALSEPFVRKRRFGPVVSMVAVPAALSLVGLPFVARRLAVSGSYAQFHGDFGTEPIGASLLGRGVLLMGLVLGVGIAWTVRSLSRMAADERS